MEMTELHYRILEVLQTTQRIEKAFLLNAFYQRLWNRNVSIEPWKVEQAIQELQRNECLEVVCWHPRQVLNITAQGMRALDMICGQIT